MGAAPTRMIKVGYFTLWSVYRDTFSSITELVIEGGYSHISVAFAVFDDSGELVFSDPYAAFEKGVMGQLKELRNQHGIKIGISVGGWNHRSMFMADEDHLSQQILLFVRHHEFDYVDIDWEFDDCYQAACNAEKLGNLLHSIRKNVPVSIALQCQIDIIEKLDLKLLPENVEWFNLMAYNFSGAWSHSSSHYSDLKTVSSAIEKLSVPHDKICLGISGYGMVFEGCRDIGSKYQSCREVSAAEISHKDAKHVWDEEASGSYFQQHDKIIFAETRTSFEQKYNFCLENSLSGVSIWDIEAFSHIPPI